MALIQNRKASLGKPATRAMFGDTDTLDPELDRAERHAIAREIAHHVATSENIRTFSINGPWGSGKTVFMKWIKTALDTREQEHVISISFNAWKYERSGNILYPLLMELKGLVTGKWNSMRLWWSASRVLSTVGILYSGGIILQTVGWKKAGDKAHDLSEKVLNFQRIFEKWVEQIIKLRGEPKLKKIVILIDELDRCSPKNVLMILESIKNFLRTERTCFVFAIDKAIVAKAISSEYKSLHFDDGQEYLEKIIEFPYELPFKAESVWHSLLQDYRKEFEEMRKVELKFVPRVIELSDTRSLRKLKKILNRFAFTLSQLKRYGVEINTELLFFLMFTYEVYPRLFEIMKSNTSIIDQIPNINVETIRNKTHHPPDMQWVIEFCQQERIREIVGELRKSVGATAVKTGYSADARQCLIALERLGI